MNEPSAASLIGQVVLPGLLIVFLALVILILAVMAMGKIMAVKKSGPSASAQPSVPPPLKASPVIPGAQGVTDDTVAAIAAAVAAVMEESSPGSSYKITGIRREKESRPIWSLAGTLQNTGPF